MHVSRTSLLFALAALVLAGCCSPKEAAHSSRIGAQEHTPGQLASDDVIRQKIVGTWQADAESFSGRVVTFAFTPDGGFVSRGAYAKSKHWRTDRGFVIVTAERDAVPSDSDQYIAIWHVDDHELVCRPGFSVAGAPWRFTK